jgi:hypothetical protein
MKDGTIVVAQRQDGVIRFFAPDGKPLSSFGAKGEGPGEFERIQRIGRTGDSVWIYDLKLQRLTILGPRRNLIRSFSLPRPAGKVKGTDLPVSGVEWLSTPSALLPNGDFLLASIAKNGAGAAIWRAFLPAGRLAVGRVSQTGELVATPFFQSTLSPQCITRSGEFETGIPECPRPWAGFAQDGNRFVEIIPTAPSSKKGAFGYNLTAYGIGGKVLYTKSLVLEGAPIPRKTADSITKANVASARSQGEAIFVSKIAVPEFAPPVSGIIIGTDGSVWVQLRAGSTERRYLGLDSQGTPIGVATLPRSTVVSVAATGHLWGVDTDSDGVESIARYRLNLSPRK